MNRRIQLTHLLAVMLVLGSFTYAQRDVAGVEWSNWKADRRIGYLIGYHAGLKADRAIFDQAVKAQSHRTPGRSSRVAMDRYRSDRKDYISPNIKYDYKLLARMIDAFYTDPDNLKIPLQTTILILRLRDSEKHQRANDILLIERRKYYVGN